MIATLRLVSSPRQTLRDVAAAPSGTRGAGIVVATAVGSLLVSGIQAAAGARGHAAAEIGVGAVASLLYIGFWWLSAVLINAGAVAMGRDSARSRFMAASASAIPVLLVYPLVTLIQLAATQAGFNDVAGALTWLAIPALAWFVALTIIAVDTVYEIGFLNSLSLTMLPYAAICAVVMVLVVVLSALHAARAI